MISYNTFFNQIIQNQGNFIDFIIDINSSNKWFFFLLKDDLIRLGYNIKSPTHMLNYNEFIEFIQNSNEKSIIFLDDNTYDFRYKIDRDTLNCNYNNQTIIFISETYNRSTINNTNINIIPISSLVISVVSNKVSIIKSRYGTTNDMYFDYSKLLRKLKLKELKIANS